MGSTGATGLIKKVDDNAGDIVLIKRHLPSGPDDPQLHGEVTDLGQVVWNEDKPNPLPDTQGGLIKAVADNTATVGEFNQRITDNATAIGSKTTDPKTGLQKDVSALYSAGLQNSNFISQNRAKILINTNAIGTATTAGSLRKGVADNKAAIGDANAGLTKRVNDNATDIGAINRLNTTQTNDISALELSVDGNASTDGLVTTVGDNTGGLVKKVADLEAGGGGSGVDFARVRYSFVVLTVVRRGTRIFNFVSEGRRAIFYFRGTARRDLPVNGYVTRQRGVIGDSDYQSGEDAYAAGIFTTILEVSRTSGTSLSNNNLSGSFITVTDATTGTVHYEYFNTTPTRANPITFLDIRKTDDPSYPRQIAITLDKAFIKAHSPDTVIPIEIYLNTFSLNSTILGRTTTDTAGNPIISNNLELTLQSSHGSALRYEGTYDAVGGSTTANLPEPSRFI